MKRWVTRLGVWTVVLMLTLSTAFAATYTAGDADEFYQVMWEQLDQQETEFTIDFGGKASSLTYISYGWTLNTGKLPTAADLQRELMARGDGEANYEYAALNLHGITLNIEDGQYIFSNLTYFDSPEELAYVEECVEEIVEWLDLEGRSDIAKIQAIYQYMTTNFVYDHTYNIYSAYQGLTTGTMVCQGYALLTSRLLDEAGLNSRAVVGLSGENHAWNLVELDGLWYSLDTTWDGTEESGTLGNWYYFMKCDDDFVNHNRFDEFNTDEFLALHTMATESYYLEALTLQASGGNLSSKLNIRLGVPVQMGATYGDGTQVEDVIWTVGNSDLIEVSADGQITGIGLGTTWIQGASGDESTDAFGACSVTVVDMGSMSSWATDIITNYYLSGMLPSDLCGSYQSELTRVDLARLADQLILMTVGYDFGEAEVPFLDIDELDDDSWNAVGRCYAVGIMNGMSTTEFAPNQTVTREQAAAVLVRVQEYISGVTHTSSGVTQFTDSASISSWAVDAVSSAQELELLQGYDTGAFKPQTVMTREQMMVALSRIDITT